MVATEASLCRLRFHALPAIATIVWGDLECGSVPAIILAPTGSVPVCRHAVGTASHASNPCDVDHACKPLRKSRASHVLSPLCPVEGEERVPVMARYLGPKVKLSRRVGVPIADIPKHTAKELQLPGMHGFRGRRNTEYGVRLTEKQKLRHHYGVLERQFRLYLQKAKKSKGNTANSLSQLLETRLDNVLR